MKRWYMAFFLFGIQYKSVRCYAAFIDPTHRDKSNTTLAKPLLIYWRFRQFKTNFIEIERKIMNYIKEMKLKWYHGEKIDSHNTIKCNEADLVMRLCADVSLDLDLYVLEDTCCSPMSIRPTHCPWHDRLSRSLLAQHNGLAVTFGKR